MSRYIDVDELIRKINEHECYSYDPEVSRICGLINDAPVLDVEPVRHGRWETVFDKIESNLSGIGYFKALPKFICSECGNEMIASTQYCPNCGARMDGGVNER